MPSRLRDVGVPRDSFPQMAEDAIKIQRLLKNNPRLITEASAIQIYESAY
jgi:alcohol dehydrogenase class IV